MKEGHSNQARQREGIPSQMTSRDPGAGLRAIAARAEVSISTVSRALADSPLISAPTKENIRAIAEEMGYRPSIALRHVLRETRLRAPAEYRYTIACIAAGIRMEEFAGIDPTAPDAESAVPIGVRQAFAMWGGITARAAELGIKLDYFDLRETPPNKVPGILRARNITAAIVYSRSVAAAERIAIENLLQRMSDVHCVAMGPGVLSRTSVTAVGVDLFEAGRRSYLKAWEAGYSQILFVPPARALDPDRRFEAGLRVAKSRLDEPTPVQILNHHQIEQWLSRATPDFCFIGSVDAVRWWPIAKKMAKGGPCPVHRVAMQPPVLQPGDDRDRPARRRPGTRRHRPRRGRPRSLRRLQQSPRHGMPAASGLDRRHQHAPLRRTSTQPPARASISARENVPLASRITRPLSLRRSRAGPAMAEEDGDSILSRRQTSLPRRPVPDRNDAQINLYPCTGSRPLPIQHGARR